MSDRIVQLVKVAGLVHDLGHVAFSHLFDDVLKRLNIKTISHEERSISLLRYMVNKYHIDLEVEELDVIDYMINGKYKKGYPKFIFEIVSNSRNGVDVDKLDYLTRDCYYTGQNTGFNLNQILRLPKVINNEICYHEKVYSSIVQMFTTRFRLHNECYKHSVVTAIGLQLIDSLVEYDKICKFKIYFNTKRWIQLTDSYITFKLMHLNDSSKSLNIYSNIINRKLYKNIDKLSDIDKDDIDENRIIKHDKKIGFISKDENPIKKIRFYNKNTDFYINNGLFIPNIIYEVVEEEYVKNI